MTWAEWLASDYNTTGETAPTIKTADFEDVSYDDVIVAGENYGFYQQTSEYTLSGVWTFVDVPDNTTKMVQELSFTSCGVDFAAIEIGNYEGILYFTNKWETYCSWNAFMDEWEIDGCNTVDFGSEPQAVSQEFYEWFIVNATKQ